MNLPGLIYLLMAHYLCGRGCLRLFRAELKPVQQFFLSVIIGVPILSFAPCIVQLLNIPIEAKSIGISVGVITALFSVPLLINFKMPKFTRPGIPALYEWPFLIVCGLLMLISIWRCFYFPPYARDMLSGPELLAEFAVREKTMVSSVFTVELSTTNNYFKSPFITSLQIIYKLLVYPFGQIWLSLLSVSFTALLYTTLRERIHGLLAGFLLMVFLIMPDPYAYTYIVLYDYSNMVFFFWGFYLLLKFVKSDKLVDLAFSAFLFGLATYIRTETLVLVFMLLPIPAFYFYKKRLPLKKAIIGLGTFFVLPLVFYIICMNVFVRNFVPFSFDAATQLNQNLSDISVFFNRIKEINTTLIFSAIGVEIYGYYIYFFCIIIAIDTIFFRRFNRESLMLLYGIAVVYFGLALLGYLIPLVDLMNTTKRGLYKALPLMLLYMANSAFLQWIAGAVRNWEFSIPKTKETVVAKPIPAAKPKVKKK